MKPILFPSQAFVKKTSPMYIMNLNKEKVFQRCHLADGVGGQPGEQGEATLEGKWREIQSVLP